MIKAVTMGEMMIRFMPHNNMKFEQADSYQTFFGGDESIVAVSLARFGIETAYITKLPENPLGRIAFNKLREQGVCTNYIAWGGKRLGLNFYENGASVRPSKVVYDRENSAFSEADLSDFDFNKIFSKVKWFHISGITPALSEKTYLLTQKAMETAKKNGVIVSCDLNYRNKLWTIEKAKSVMPQLMKYVDVCINPDVSLDLDREMFISEPDIQKYKQMFEQIKKQYEFKFICSTLRNSISASDNSWSGILYDGKEFYHTKKYDIHLVDRGGGGASFSAGIIYGLLMGKSLAQIGEFAIAASALKQTVVGDFNLTDLEDIELLANGDSSGRVQR